MFSKIKELNNEIKNYIEAKQKNDNKYSIMIPELRSLTLLENAFKIEEKVYKLYNVSKFDLDLNFTNSFKRHIEIFQNKIKRNIAKIHFAIILYLLKFA